LKHTQIKSLYLGEGDTFYGEGILAVTKALLQAGVAYVGGYQGAPISHLLDVMVQSHELMAELGVKVATCTNEAAAAAMLGASINYPVRGAVTWKSVVGTNVASDALANLASPGVIGGCLIILGEDYGEGASVIQERSLAFALKSTMWLLDPRPNLPTITHLVEKGFELSEASHALASFAPFNSGNTILGYGMSLASAAAVSSINKTRPISIMGDGGFWHNGLITGVAGSVFNGDDSMWNISSRGLKSSVRCYRPGWPGRF
jgi:TPP-dependent indolepyruvate ferredoxin oxidoreductase alpha subunit